MATVLFLLHTANGDLNSNSLRIFTDSEVTRRILTSLKARSFGLASILEDVDYHLSKHNTNVSWDYVTTDTNLADPLSRDNVPEFLIKFRAIFPNARDPCPIQVDQSVRDISRWIETFNRHPHWFQFDDVDDV